MDILLTVIGIIFGLLVAHFYYKKSKSESKKEIEELKLSNNNLVSEHEKQTKIIKQEFDKLNKQIISLEKDDISDTTKKESIKSISNELESWIEKLDSDPGEIENKINTKKNELNNDRNKKSTLLRKYMLKVLDNIDIIINTLNKTGKDISWEKPQLPANIYDSNISTKFKFNKIDRESIEVRNFLDDIHIMIENYEEKDLMKQNTVRFKFSIYDNYRINLSINASNEFSFINEHYHFDIEQADTIYLESLKDLFEYLVIKYSK